MRTHTHKRTRKLTYDVLYDDKPPADLSGPNITYTHIGETGNIYLFMWAIHLLFGNSGTQYLSIIRYA